MGPHLHLWCYFYALLASRPLFPIIKERLGRPGGGSTFLPGVVAELYALSHPPQGGQLLTPPSPLIGRQCLAMSCQPPLNGSRDSLVASVYADSAQSTRTWPERYNKLLNTSEHYKIFAICFVEPPKLNWHSPYPPPLVHVSEAMIYN